MEDEIININEFNYSTDYKSFDNIIKQDELLIAYDQTYIIYSLINDQIDNLSQREKIFNIIIKILKNILDYPYDDKYRKIKLSNIHIQSLFEISGVYDFFIYLGFKEHVIDNELFLYLNNIDNTREEFYKLVLSYIQLLCSSDNDNNYFKDKNLKEEIDIPTLEEMNHHNNILNVLKNRYSNYNTLIPNSKSKTKDIKSILKETANIRKNNTYSYGSMNSNSINNNQNRIMTLNDIRYSNPIDKTINKSNDEIGKKCLQLTNEFRCRNNLNPLQWDEHIWKISYGHSENMGLKKIKFGHDGFNDRIKKLPFYYSLACENVYMCQGYSEYNLAEMAVNGWINSPGHRKNLLSHTSHCAIAIYRNGYGEFFLTQIFIRK